VSVLAQFPSVFLIVGIATVGLLNFFVAFQMNWSSGARLVI
jgi:hypothetical protein